MDSKELQRRLRDHVDLLRRDHRVARLEVFGSVARGEATEGSDVDLLVAFDGPATLDGYMALRRELEAILGCPVDLVTERAVRASLRAGIEREAIRVA